MCNFYIIVQFTYSSISWLYLVALLASNEKHVYKFVNLTIVQRKGCGKLRVGKLTVAELYSPAMRVLTALYKDCKTNRQSHRPNCGINLTALNASMFCIL